jgi:quinol monooxygenase YgiN
MTKFGLLVRLEAKPGKEKEIEEFLKSGLTIVEREPGTITWYALRLGPTTFGIFDTFDDEQGRNAHLNGQVAKALFEKAPGLFSKQPSVEKLDLLVSKMAQPAHA